MNAMLTRLLRNFQRVICIFLLCTSVAAWPRAVAGEDKADAAKPKAAFFPIGGAGDEAMRTRTANSLRAKLDRDGHYEVIDGYKMKDLAAESKTPIGFDTSADAIKELAAEVDATVLVWGDMDAGGQLRLHILDLRQKDAKPRDLTKVVAQPTDLRFVSEQILATIPGVGPFEHPNEESVTDDALSRQLWEKNPNLLVNGDFAKNGKWNALYQAEKYEVALQDALPAVDKVCIYRIAAEGAAPAHNVLAMNLSKDCAENNGMACLSDAIKIEPNTRYRISFRYKSDGPTLHVFVKGYTMAQDVKGQPAEREVYRRQVPPSDATGGQWVTVVDDFNPQHIAFPVQTLRVDLYAYLTPGSVMFDNVIVKSVGPQTHRAKDDAIKLPVTKPAVEK